MTQTHQGRAKPRRKGPRKALACSECTRRKLRCSKLIPCTACVDRGIAEICRRKDSLPQLSSTSSRFQSENSPRTHRTRVHEAEADRPSASMQIRSSPSPSEPHRGSLIDSVAADTPVTLEFLTLGRKRILTQAGDGVIATPSLIGQTSFEANAVFSLQQVQHMLKYHEDNLVWTHNVVHLSTFKQQCLHFLTSKSPLSHQWLALYYAMLSITLHLTSPDVLFAVGIYEPTTTAVQLYRMTLEALHNADYTADHNIASVQAICLLIYVGYSIGDSDRISVLLASATRIAQCLGIHRLGPDNPETLLALTEKERVRLLIDREVQKRVWWFLIRQDWLQIPFSNTYNVHPSQFNTPMPVNCYDDPDIMISHNQLHERSKARYTHNSYTSVLNDVAALIWKTQDRMCRLGHPNKSTDGLRSLYDEVLWADKQLKAIMHELPEFYRNADQDNDGKLPANITQQRKALLLTLAHKFYSIHRHFQVTSFKDPRFAYSRVSCVSICLRGLQGVFELPPNEHTYTIKNLWTVDTQLVTATIWIIFELLFTRDEADRTQSTLEMESAVQGCLDALQGVQNWSYIARNGVNLIRLLLRTRNEGNGTRAEAFSVKDIISSIRQSIAQEESLQNEQNLPFDMPLLEDWMSLLNELGTPQQETMNSNLY